MNIFCVCQKIVQYIHIRMILLSEIGIGICPKNHLSVGV